MFFKKKQHNLLALTITPSHLTLTNEKTSRIISSIGIISDDLYILNLSLLVNFISRFTQNTSSSKAVIALEGKMLTEQLSPTEFQSKQKNLVWYSCPISYQSNSYWYSCGLTRELIFQYQLLCYLSGLKLINLTSITAAKLIQHRQALIHTDIKNLKKELEYIDSEYAVLQIAEKYI